MSIRFRVTVAPSGKKYGAIVNTFRDKATGKLKDLKVMASLMTKN
ncbi:hypothetical protein [Succinatimonas hippei]|nr:hypothetical protein [Succinatimonas hippei]